MDIKSERIPGQTPKKFSDRGRWFYYVRIFVDATPAELKTIELVKYTLHPTFKEPIRVSDSPSNHFEIRIWTYGYFDVVALLIMKDGTTRNLRGNVKWEIGPNEILTDDESAPANAAG
jgi:hypothetical protein